MSDEAWLTAMWPFVRDNLPAPPARVVEIGCGPLGGFVPRLIGSGHEATGVDPEAPRGPAYRGVDFETFDAPPGVEAIVACTSLHHVADLGDVLAKAHAMLAPSGVLVVVEWARERFDEATARWCFQHLEDPGDEPGWLHERRTGWQESGESWEDYCRRWAEQEGLHLGVEMLRELDARFDPDRLEFGPYFFADLDGVTEAEEQAAIDAGLIRATRLGYVGRPR